MSWETKPLQQATERELHLLAKQRGSELVAAVTLIIFTNLDKGRMQTFLERQDCSPANYVQRVADHYEQWHDYVHAVQVEKRSDVWEPLYEQLQQWAFRLLPRIGYPAYVDRDEQLQQAQACATEAATVLLNAFFPYDVDFEPWAYVLLRNVTRKEMNRRIRPRLDVQKHQVELDAWDDWLHNLADPEGEDEQRLAELRADLLQLVAQLSSEARQQFILFYYFEEQSFEQIAAQMNKNLNSLYKLHSDALENLRKIWRKNRDKYE
jgi:RNA polymerase sigma factor (sigma-70 family)